MDLFCHPARREGFGYVIVEAMATGLPVIVSDSSNMPELVPDGESGILCDPENGKLWRRAIRNLLDDTNLAQKLALSGQDRARKLFSFDRMLDEVLEYFESII